MSDRLTIEEALKAITEWDNADRELKALPEIAYLKDIDPLCAAIRRKNDAEIRLHEINVKARIEYSHE